MTLHEVIQQAKAADDTRIAADLAKTNAANVLQSATEADAAATTNAATALAKLAAVLPVGSAYAASDTHIVINLNGTPTFLNVVDPETVTIPDA